MANAFIKPERLVATMLGGLEREIQVPGLVTLNATGDFKGAKDDTISLRVPAYTTARSRTMRSGTLPIEVDDLNETKVDLKLDTNVYKAVGVSLEEQDLDIVDFEAQVALPVASSVARKVEDVMIDTISNGSYDLTGTIDSSNAYDGVVDARKALNLAMVPPSQRALVVGADVEAAILKDDHFNRVDASGTDSALRDATIGRIAGFTVVTAVSLPPDKAYAFHKTAFLLAMRAPSVPRGAVTGASRAYQGVSMTVIQDYDQLYLKDRFVAHVFVGAAITQDHGSLDSSGGLADLRYTPSDTPDTDNGSDLVIARVVELTLT